MEDESSPGADVPAVVVSVGRGGTIDLGGPSCHWQQQPATSAAAAVKATVLSEIVASY